MHQEIFLTYLYCFCDQPVELPAFSFERPLQLLPVGKNYAVIENVSSKDFSELALQKNMAEMDWLLPKVNLHESVVQDLMNKATVLPIKFATIFSTDNNIVELYNANKADYEDNFKKLKGKQEWGIKVYSAADDSWLLQQANDKEINEAKEMLASATPGKAFLMKKKIQGLINRKKSEINKTLGSELYRALKTGTVESLQKSILPAQTDTDNDSKLILNSVFLLEKGAVEQWLANIQNVETELGNDKIVFDVTGPWPPYHFVG